MDGTVIVADDDRTIRTVLSQALTRAGCRVRATSTIATLWQWVEEGEGDVVVTDVIMPDGHALDIIPAIGRKRPELPVIVMSAQNTVMTAIRAAEVGAFEYLPKPFDLKDMLSHVSRALTASRGGAQAPPDRDTEAQDKPALPLIGGSSAMQEVYRILARLMNTDLSIVISGESGTGKELVARTLHKYGHRSQGPFETYNIAAADVAAVDADLFGTGGGEAQKGKFAAASGGTLFLDEVGDLPEESQKRLLRVLQDGLYRPVGGRTDERTDTRIVAATSNDLRALIDEGRFREDLFYRLNVVPIHLPPLRDRIEDIPDLAREFLRNAAGTGLPNKTFSKSALDRLRRERWPGNVRELENFVRRIVALSSDDTMDASLVEKEIARSPGNSAQNQPDGSQNLSQMVQANLERYFELHGNNLPPPGLYHRILKEVEHPLLALTLSATRGNQVKAAEILGINRNTLRKKVQELDIRVTRSKRLM